jgi:hypothetical protein
VTYRSPGSDLDNEEFCSRCLAGVDSTEHHEKCVITGYAHDGESAPEPPSIEDMTPGTTFIASWTWTDGPWHHFMKTTDRNRPLRDENGMWSNISQIDPKTIRDVVPAKETP